MLKDKKVLVTGGTSMIGGYISKILNIRGATVNMCRHSECDLLDIRDVRDIFNEFKPDYVVHAAGWNGGIEWNKLYPADIFYKTTVMALNVLRVAQIYKVKKMVSILASCSYPDKGHEVLLENNLWEGLPNSTVECHGLAKRTIHSYGRQLYTQHKFNNISCVLTNCYGPRDSFDPVKTKVVAALIKKIVDAKRQNLKKIICWGSGAPKRELMFAPDAAECIVQTLEKYNNNLQPVNIGIGEDISIRELTKLIAEIVGYEGEIFWDLNKPDGQLKKLLDNNTMMSYVDIKFTDIKDGLTETINWYMNYGK